MNHRKPREMHGLTHNRLFPIWCNMLARCYNPKTRMFKFYGGRGITVCDEWKNNPLSFINWSSSNGYQEGLSIDRIDNDGDYCPENCRWTDWKTQNRNRRDNVYVLFDGKKRTLSEIAEITGIPRQTIRVRYLKGYSDNELIKYQRKVKPKSFIQNNWVEK